MSLLSITNAKPNRFHLVRETFLCRNIMESGKYVLREKREVISNLNTMYYRSVLVYYLQAEVQVYTG